MLEVEEDFYQAFLEEDQHHKEEFNQLVNDLMRQVKITS